jgi:hypothetical protein
LDIGDPIAVLVHTVVPDFRGAGIDAGVAIVAVRFGVEAVTVAVLGAVLGAVLAADYAPPPAPEQPAQASIRSHFTGLFEMLAWGTSALCEAPGASRGQ